MPPLPTFRYHPDPISTGAIVPSQVVCACCDQVRGYVYVGPVYALGDHQDCLCPWCVADGSANLKFGATFTDKAGIGGYGEWDDVPDDVVKEIASRSPGFSGWQQERWWTHCGDAGAFLGRAGRVELETLGKDAIEAIRADTGLDGVRWTGFFRALAKDGSPTAYVFRCRHCDAIGGYQDCD